MAISSNKYDYINCVLLLIIYCHRTAHPGKINTVVPSCEEKRYYTFKGYRLIIRYLTTTILKIRLHEQNLWLPDTRRGYEENSEFFQTLPKALFKKIK